MDHTYDNDKLLACIRQIFSEFLETGDTCGKAIYISKDGTYDVRPQYQSDENTLECICLDYYLERDYNLIPELPKIRKAHDSAWQNEHYKEDIAELQRQMYARYDGDREMLLEDLVDDAFGGILVNSIQ